VFHVLEAQNYALMNLFKQISEVRQILSENTFTSTNHTLASSSGSAGNFIFDLPCDTDLAFVSLERDIENGQKFDCLVRIFKYIMFTNVHVAYIDGVFAYVHKS